MKWKVLVSAPYLQPVIGRFRHLFEKSEIELVLPAVRERLSEDELLQRIRDVDGIIAGDDPLNEKVLQAATRLKVISKWGTGIDSIDVRACERLGIKVCNTPGAFTQAVADTALGYMLCFARQLPWMDQEVKRGMWHKRTCVSLHESTVGIIGVGAIGKAVVRRAISFGAKVLGNDRVEMPQEFITQTGIMMVSKEDLLRQADFVSIHCDLNPTSFHLLSDKEFSLMKSQAYLINTARGSIVDEWSLIKALKARAIAGAALDVFEEEPLAEDSPLRGMDHVLLGPHNANSSIEAWEMIHQRTVQNLIEVLQKGA